MIYKFATLPDEKETAVGGKGATLAKLFQHGFHVPDGFIIDLASFENATLSDAAWHEVQQTLQTFRNGNGRTAFAVRSSALSEDSAQASFAGEFETVLNLQADEDIRKAINQVHQSGQSARVQAYSQAQGLPQKQQVAVIVQKMAQAEFAGVLFTADPVSGSHSQMVGNFVQGLAETLVSGEATAQTFTLSRPKGHYDGPAILRHYGRQLFQTAKKIETELGAPQDIEWAVAAGKLFILQARPITTMEFYNPQTGAWNDSFRGDYLWTNANFGEAVPDVMTPMTWSMLQLYGREVFTIPLPGNHTLFGNIGGRLYLNVTLYISMMKTVGFGQERIQNQAVEFFGRIPNNGEIPLIPFNRWQIIKAFIKAAPKAMRRVRRDRKQLPEFTTGVLPNCNRLNQQITQAQSTAELLRIWDELLPYFQRACQMLQAGTGLFEDLIRPLRQELSKTIGAEKANILLSGFSQGDEQLASLGPILGLWRIQQGEISEADFYQQFGHRGPHEFELSLPRPTEDRHWLAEQSANVTEVDIPALLAKQAQEKEVVWQQFKAEYPGKAKKVASKLETIANAARGRETIRSEIIRLVGIIRQFALKAGTITELDERVFFLRLEELAAMLAGDATAVALIPQRQRTHEQMLALPIYPGLINGRFDPQQWAKDPKRRQDVYDAHQKTANLSDCSEVGEITGFPGAAGVVEGIVRKLNKPEEGHLLQPGEILVTTTTNIGWTPLFPKVSAIVTDVGAPLSHAAIVARELGIPAVVGCGNATMTLNTGDKVRVNGSQGQIVILRSTKSGA